LALEGIALPLQITPLGKFKRVKDAKYVNQLIITALSDCSSENPFIDLGFDTSIIFSSVANEVITRIEHYIEAVFTGFEVEDLARLLEHSVSVVDEGTIEAVVRYENLIDSSTQRIGVTFN